MKNRMLRLVSAIAVIALAVCVSVCAAGFQKTLTYAEGTFNDVPAAEWYAKEVQGAYELGLMNGKGEGMFVPQGNVTVAEAITMAARACAAYAGEEIPAAQGEWYQMYVNYAIQKGFLEDGQFDNFTRLAKRYEVASLFENAMPEGYYTAKNNVDEIPDVDAALPYENDLMKQYGFSATEGHIAIHKKFVDQVIGLKKRFEAGEKIMGVNVMDFLKDWLESHIMKTDKVLAKFLKSNVPNV